MYKTFIVVLEFYNSMKVYINFGVDCWKQEI
ncbi:hypothetical protein SAMN05192585_13030 [Acetanaerobacterium elongatum]|uniref:Uncharacterized protein n=1 Tax=Acetanaerobacterium elongatum TaxID=258515 RepID=A0A1H0DV69_9FIRM|nr:hypothetical protein SAMN05192585_13030 [Acetanaerobacterium elongatum]